MRAIIIERWGILRHGLRAVLGQAGNPVLSAADSAQEGLDAVRAARDLQLVVVGLTDDAHPADLVADVLALAPAARVLVLTDHPDRASVDAILRSGASGILGRIVECSEVLDAVDRIRRGERVLCGEVISTLVGALEPDEVADAYGGGSAIPLLTVREQEVLRCLATGASNREIGARLFIGEATVKTHLASTYAKLGVANRHQAVARGIEAGLVAWRAAIGG